MQGAPPTPELNPNGAAVSPGQAGYGGRRGSYRRSDRAPGGRQFQHAEHFAAAQRPAFGLMFVTVGGSGWHSVDFDQISLASGRIVFVRPGQVQQWHVDSAVEAHVVLARPELCHVSEWFPGQSSHRDLGAASMASVEDLVSVLAREQDRFTPEAVSVRLLGNVFSGLVDLFDRPATGASVTDLPDAYVAYRRAIEADFGQSHDARWFIRELGYSERTVTRACLQVTGLTAKAVLDQRVMLEAKRLLAHTETPVGQIGQALGFGEASNFNKFFSRHAGMLPSQFRAGLREGGWSADTPA